MLRNNKNYLAVNSVENQEKIKKAREAIKNISINDLDLEFCGLEEKKDQVLEHITSAPILVRGKLIKQFRGALGKSDSISLKCYECCGFEDFRTRADQCQSWRCPLWNHRPRQSTNNDTEEGV